MGRRLYWPEKRGDQLAALNFEIRTHSDARAMIPVIRQELRRFDPNPKGHEPAIHRHSDRRQL